MVKKRWKRKRNAGERNGKETGKKRTTYAKEMGKKRVERNGKETLTAFFLTLSKHMQNPHKSMQNPYQSL